MKISSKLKINSNDAKSSKEFLIIDDVRGQ